MERDINILNLAKGTCLRRLSAGISAVACAMIVSAGGVRAQAPSLPPEQLKEAEALVEEAQTKMGPWENQVPIIEDATDNIFKQQGWNSPEDQWARQVMREVSGIPPWKAAERQDVFMNSIQSRWNLSHDQRNQLNGSLQRETMMLTFKHIKDVMPVAMDALRTRANGQPFTPEQIQQWSTKLRPMIDDGMLTVQRVTQQLEKTMTEDQRKLLQADLAAFTKRHNDMQKLVQKWQSGQWQPTDWGLQNDPVHAPVMQQYAQRDAERNALVEQAQTTKQDDAKFASNESEWDKYVKAFCRKYECDERQISAAEAILKKLKGEAINYRMRHEADIQKTERLVTSTNPGSSMHKEAQGELARMLQPINQNFERLKASLDELLTTQQRNQFGTAPVAQSSTR